MRNHDDLTPILRAKARVVLDIFNSIPEGILVCDCSQQIILVNQSFCARLGYELDELKNRALDLLLPESVRGRHRIDAATFLWSKERQSARAMGGRPGPFILLAKDGSVVRCDVSIARVPTPNGNLAVALIRWIGDCCRPDCAAQRGESQEEP